MSSRRKKAPSKFQDFNAMRAARRQIFSDGEDEAESGGNTTWAEYTHGAEHGDHGEAIHLLMNFNVNKWCKPNLYKSTGSLDEKRRHKAEVRFFDPSRSKKKAMIKQFLSLQILPHRYRDPRGTSPEAVSLEGRSARMLVSVETLYQQRVIELSVSRDEPTTGLPRSQTDFLQSTSTSPIRQDKGPLELYKVGESFIHAHHITGKNCRERLGETLILYLGTYGHINSRLDSLTGRIAARESALVGVLIDFARSHKALTATTLHGVAAARGVGLQSDVIDNLHRLAFLLFVKEPAAWQSAAYFEAQGQHEKLEEPPWKGPMVLNEWKIGMAVAFARSLLLVKEGHLSLRQILGSDGTYAVYPTKSMYTKNMEVRDTCSEIDALYRKKLRRELTTEQAHQDLIEVFGGESDSSGDEYSDISGASDDDDSSDDDDDFVDDDDAESDDSEPSTDSGTEFDLFEVNTSTGRKMGYTTPLKKRRVS